MPGTGKLWLGVRVFSSRELVLLFSSGSRCYCSGVVVQFEGVGVVVQFEGVGVVL